MTTPRLHPAIGFSLLALALTCASVGVASARCICAQNAPKARACAPGKTRVATANFSRLRHKARDYDVVNAYLSALASRATEHGTHASNTERHFQSRACRMFLKWGFDRVEFPLDTATSTQGVLAFHKNFTLLAFRGSEFGRSLLSKSGGKPRLNVNALSSMLKDWVATDANMRQVPAGPKFANRGKLHRGFKTAVESVLPEIIRSIESSGRKTNPIYVTGHSLGGAVATLAAYGLKLAKLPVKALYAHAPPRVGDVVFRTALLTSGIKLFRSIHSRDPIPVFPPSITVNRFIPTPYVDSATHTLVFLTPSGRVRLNPSPALMARERGPILNPLDHDIATYVSRLRRAVPASSRQGLPR